jgi:hypothetical protein
MRRPVKIRQRRKRRSELKQDFPTGEDLAKAEKLARKVGLDDFVNAKGENDG